MHEGFDVEGVSGGWLEDIQREWPLLAAAPSTENGENGVAGSHGPSAVEHYEEWVPHASVGLQITEREGDNTVVEMESEDAQAFLAEQARVLEAMRLKAAEMDREKDGGKGGRKGEDLDVRTGSVVTDHIGPVQFNMGGIQVDADDMLQRIKVSWAPALQACGVLVSEVRDFVADAWECRNARSTSPPARPRRRRRTPRPTPRTARG